MWKWISSHWITFSVTTLLATLLAAVGVWKAMREFWRWWLSRRDAPVLRVLKGRDEEARKNGFNVIPENFPLDAIAVTVGKPSRKVPKSLARLREQGKVLEHRDGWSLTTNFPGDIGGMTDNPRFKPRF
jgi:hypothetical protein